MFDTFVSRKRRLSAKHFKECAPQSVEIGSRCSLLIRRLQFGCGIVCHRRIERAAHGACAEPRWHEHDLRGTFTRNPDRLGANATMEQSGCVQLRKSLCDRRGDGRRLGYAEPSATS